MSNIALRAGLVLLLASSTSLAQESSDKGDSDSSSLSESQAGLKTEKQDGASEAPKKSDAPAEASDEDKESPEDSTYGHGFQFGLRGGVLFIGTQIYLRYDKSPLCAAYDPGKNPNDQRKSCGFQAPPSTEVALSFGVLDSVEPYIFGRFGFSGQAATNTKPLMMYGVGARLYTMSDSRFKVFVEPALAYETEGGAGNPNWQHAGFTPNYAKDLIFHIGVGPQYDFAKAFGLYLNGNVDVGVIRAISATLSLNVGIQLRFL